MLFRSEIKTNTKRVLESRKTTVELLLSNHNNSCNSCVRSNNCELQKLSHELGCDENRYKGVKQSFEEDVTPYLVRDNSKCILCRRCVAACSKLQHVHVIGPNDRGFNTNIGSEFDLSLNDVKCVACGQCITVCPTGALRERDNIDDVMAVMNDKSKHVFAMTAPAVRAAIGEEFGYPIGTNTEGKMVAALKMLGFEKVMDVDFAADVTIMEEGTELLNRIKNNGVLPMITSCSPGWINYIEQYYPELLPHLSTTKSPQQIHGALIKSYYAKKHNLDPKDIVVVSIMPCVAKKVEINRPHINAVEEGKDVDFVLTTREAARFIRRAGIDFRALPDEQFDTFSGTSAGLLFGATGGVMEAALRTVKEILDGKELDNLDFKSVRGVKGVKKATVELGGKPVKVVVAHGVENAHTVMEQLKAGKLNDVAFIEIMCCPGGCVTGASVGCLRHAAVCLCRIRLLIHQPVHIGKAPEHRLVPQPLGCRQRRLRVLPAGGPQILHLIPVGVLHIPVQAHDLLLQRRSLQLGHGSVGHAVVPQYMPLVHHPLHQRRLLPGVIPRQKEDRLHILFLQRIQDLRRVTVFIKSFCEPRRKDNL